MPTPFFQILEGEIDVTARLAGRNISLTLTDGVGRSADTVRYVVDNKNATVAPPETGRTIRIVAGYREGRIRDFGLFTVDAVTLSGWPQTIDVTAQAIDARGMVKQRRKASYQAPQFSSYGDVFNMIAGRNGLKLSMSPELAGKPLAYEAQSEEDDLEFLTRLGDKIGVAVSVKSGHVTAVRRGAGLSASGQRLPVIYVAAGRNVLSYSVNIKDRPKYGSVKATWFDRAQVQTKEVERPSFNEGPTFLIREAFASEAEAGEAAAAKAADLKRAIGTATFEINGDPFAMAESDVEVFGIGAFVDGRWRATTVTHNWSASGPYTTTVACEAPEAGPTSTQPKIEQPADIPIPTPRPQ